MKQLFPPEIIEFSIENYFNKYSKRSQVIYISVLLAFLAAIVALPFIKVEVTTQSRGVIKSETENNQLMSMVYGEIEKMTIAENMAVLEGDTLVVINTGKLQEQVAAYQRNADENLAFQKDIQTILNYRPEKIKTPKYLSQYNEYATQLKEQQLQTELLKREKEVSDQLYAKKVETEMDHLKAVNSYNLSLRREKLIHDQFHKSLQAELSRLEIENKDLSSSISQLKEEQNQYVITAPVSGTIIQYSGLSKGNFIMPNQVIAQISPTSGLLVECYVSPADIGYLNVGTMARFQFDAFNYNQWGTANGKIVEISSDLIAVNEQSVFKIRCSLDDEYLSLKNGYKGNLKKGMTLTGRFSLTERTLWQLLFDKVDNWLNPKLAEN
ncbi:MAG TPA: HlyD family efflux transporter periplasmic adaptor subunit [Prolixibacteraceae bacterium]|nr:HlyD family efflux transporter periplasmic adaptor subunit [Prolixibacteraceae bacterium]